MMPIFTDKAGSTEAAIHKNNNSSVNSQFSDNRSSAVAQRKLQQKMQSKPESVARTALRSYAPSSSSIQMYVTDDCESKELSFQRSIGLPIQKVATTGSDLKGLNQVNRWAECEPAINTLIKSSLFGDEEERHEVIVKARPGGNGMLVEKFGTTSIYQYDEDGKEWKPIGSTPSFSDAATKCYCVYIELLMGANNTTEKLFTTFLHEWNAHAIPAMALIKNKEAVERDDVEWENFEHLKYSQMSDEDLKLSVNALLEGKTEVIRESVYKSIKRDRDSYKV